ncbi:MAG: hypothetical protein ACRCYZ_02575 [Alphaproteobacteria bacterium]
MAEKEDASAIGENITMTSLKKRSFKDTLSILGNEKHADHAIVRSHLTTPEHFRDYTQSLSLGNISELAKMDPDYKSFAVMALLGSLDKNRVKHAGSLTLEIFNDAGLTRHHKTVQEALLTHFQTAPERILPLEHVKTFMGRGEALNFWGSLYLFKSKDDEKRAAAEEKLLGALKDTSHPHHQFTRDQLQDHFQNADKRIIPLKTMEKIFKELPALTFHGSLHLFKSNDAKKHAVGFKNLKEILSDSKHLSHSDARYVLSSSNEFEEITKKLSKKQKDELSNIFNKNNYMCPAGVGIPSPKLDCSFDSDAIQPIDSPIPAPRTMRAEMKPTDIQNDPADFTELLNKVSGISRNLLPSVVADLKKLSLDQQSIVFQHLTNQNPTDGYALSQALKSFTNSSLTQEEKNILATTAWNLNPEY